jgi:KDO2-lipid IV(A) lauroyltransferase
LIGNYIIGDNTSMQTPLPDRPSFAPRHWGGWLAVGFIWLMGQMPQGFGIALSAPLGWLVMKTMGRRRKIAQRNIERCFPELGPEEHEVLVRKHFRAAARLLFETAWVWSAPAKRLDSWGNAENSHHVKQALESGRGVLVLTAHSTCIEIAGWYAARSVTVAPRVVYRPLNNAVVEWYSLRCRRRFVGGMIKKRVFGSMVEFLGKGGLLWYAPDQDFGPKRSEFAPFFGIQTATLAAIVRLVERSGCVVVPMFTAFDDESRRYIARFQPALENFPSGDLVADLARVNALIEDHVRQWPHQYWWIHRRFKTRPEGEPPFYD